MLEGKVKMNEQQSVGAHPRPGEPEGVASERAASRLGQVDKDGVLVLQDHLLPTGWEHVRMQLLVHQHEGLQVKTIRYKTPLYRLFFQMKQCFLLYIYRQ